MLCKWRWVFIVSALLLYIYRTYLGYQGQLQVPLYRLSIESSLWIYSVFAFGYKHLNKNSNTLKYLSQSAYPIYIIHMIFIYLASYFVFPLNINVHLKYLIVVVFLFIGSFAFYKLFIRRFALIRPLFGLNI